MWPGLQQPVTSAPVSTVTDGSVMLESNTEGANIGYQILRGGESVSATWQVYQQPIRLQQDTTLIAMAHRIGFKPSERIVVEN